MRLHDCTHTHTHTHTHYSIQGHAHTHTNAHKTHTHTHTHTHTQTHLMRSDTCTAASQAPETKLTTESKQCQNRALRRPWSTLFLCLRVCVCCHSTSVY